MNDIDLSSYSNWDPIGDADSGVGFTGTLDGNGYTISNLTINRPDEDWGGLFCIIGDPNTRTGGEVRNLGIDAVDILGNNASGLAVGSFGTITNCYVTGDVTGNEFAGGLVCENRGIITNSYAAAVSVMGNDYASGGLVGFNVGTISNSYASGSITGSTCVGGLVGDNYGGTITNCYADGNVNGGMYTGGLAGRNRDRGIITNSYATGLVQGATYTGGLVGYNPHGSIENSNCNTESTGQSVAVGYNDGGTEINNKGLTTAEMQDPSNWSGWDTSIWDFSTYPPKLKWQTQSSTNPGGGTDPSNPGGGTGGAGDEPIPGAVRLQIGSDSSSTSAIYVDTSFDLGAFDVDFSSVDSCAAAIEDIDEVLSRINTKRSEYGAVINRLSSVLESQTTTIQNFTSAKSTIMDADIANESADFVKNQILQQTSSALLAQSQNLHASIVLSLIG